MEPRCNICRGVWHPATGHYVSESMRWCGPCTRAWVKELVGMQKRRWGGERFYDHAKVPPPATYGDFTFYLYPALPTDDPARFTVPTLTARGVNVEEAYVAISERIPSGSMVWCWAEGV